MENSQNFIPILFKVLFAFVALNMIVNFTLLYIKRQHINKIMAVFWPTMLVYYMIMGAFQQGDLSIAMAYSFGLFCSLLVATIGFEAIGRKFPWKGYILAMLPLLPLTYWLSFKNVGFTTLAMPITILVSMPVLHAFLYMNFIDYHKTTRLQKVLGVVFFLHGIHCLNFAIFRMEPDAQLWGWVVSYALCDFLAVLLPSISLEVAGLSEKERLQKLVDEKTLELSNTLKANENLFKVLIHDIGNPLMVIRGNLYINQKGRENSEVVLEKIEKSANTINSIIEQVKIIYKAKNAHNTTLAPVALEECFKDVSFIFEEPLKHKNVALNFQNHLPPGTKVLADKTSLTHSVLSNIISNSIKFNSPHSKIEITAREEKENVVLEVRDEGPGIPVEIIEKLMSGKELQSTYGSLGEKGTGLGLTIAKTFVDSYGGQLEIDSPLMNPQPGSYGTNVKITLDRAPN